MLKNKKTLKGFVVFLCLTVCLSFSSVTAGAAETEQTASPEIVIEEASGVQLDGNVTENTDGTDNAQETVSAEDIRNTKIVDFKLTAKKKTRLKFTWDVESENENVKLDGYQVLRSFKKAKKFSKYSVVWAMSSKKCSDTMIKSKQTYRYKVRGYVDTPEGRIYTKCSKVIKVTTK